MRHLAGVPPVRVVQPICFSTHCENRNQGVWLGLLARLLRCETVAAPPRVSVAIWISSPDLRGFAGSTSVSSRSRLNSLSERMASRMKVCQISAGRLPPVTRFMGEVIVSDPDTYDKVRSRRPRRIGPITLPQNENPKLMPGLR